MAIHPKYLQRLFQPFPVQASLFSGSPSPVGNCLPKSPFFVRHFTKYCSLPETKPIVARAAYPNWHFVVSHCACLTWRFAIGTRPFPTFRPYTPKRNHRSRSLHALWVLWRKGQRSLGFLEMTSALTSSPRGAKRAPHRSKRKLGFI